MGEVLRGRIRHSKLSFGLMQKIVPLVFNWAFGSITLLPKSLTISGLFKDKSLEIQVKDILQFASNKPILIEFVKIYYKDKDGDIQDFEFSANHAFSKNTAKIVSYLNEHKIKRVDFS